MKIEHLRYFYEVSQTKCMSAAGERCHVTQQTISAAIKNLEAEFNVVLLKRTNRGVELTKAGQYFLQEAQIMLESYLRLVSYCDEQSVESMASRQTIKLACAPIFMVSVMPGALAQLLKIFPNLNLEIDEYMPLVCMEKIKAQKCDMAFLNVSEKEYQRLQLALQDGWKVTLLAEDRICAVVSQKRYAEGKTRLSIRELLEQPIVTCGMNEEGEQWALKAVFKGKIPSNHISTTSINMQFYCVQQNNYIGFCGKKVWKYAPEEQREHLKTMAVTPTIKQYYVAVVRKEWLAQLPIMHLMALLTSALGK